MRGDEGAMLHTGTRHSPHFGTGVASPAAAAKCPLESRPAPPARPGSLFGAGGAWGGLRARQDGLGEHQFLSWVLNQLPVPVWELPSAGAAQTPVGSHRVLGVRE